MSIIDFETRHKTLTERAGQPDQAAPPEPDGAQWAKFHESVKDANLMQGIMIGWTNDGSMYFSSMDTTATIDAVGLCRLAEHVLLDSMLETWEE